MLTARVEDSGRYERHYIIAGIDDETLSQAKNIFEEYRAKGIIQSGNFTDAEWVITNQVKRTTFRFTVNEFTFKRFAEKWLGCSYHCFVNGIKAYAIFQMGSIGLAGIHEIVRKLTRLTEISVDTLPVDVHVIEFLKLLPGGEAKDQVVEDLEERYMFDRQKHTVKRQRVLAEFEVYFRFNEVLEDFWVKANEWDKLFYFPLYFWWTLTAILPLRPTEFLLTPRQCIERKKGENILTVRRTKLKGGFQKIYYSIDGDYRLMKYSVPDKMAAEIEWYMKSTAKLPTTTLNTLFVQSPHYSYINTSAPTSSVYYSYQNLSYCLRRFQDNIMKLDSNKSRINLGDTRHLAMISLIVSGGSPVICKELAGHEDINISAHYYSNISRFIECAAYEMYRKQKGHSVGMYESKPFSVRESIPVLGGRCDSNLYINGGVGDCVRSIGLGGELGHCASCPHFIDGKSGQYLLFSNKDTRKSQVDADSKYLMHMLEMVRKGRGCNEDIQSALLRLQHSSSEYSHSLFQKMGGI